MAVGGGRSCRRFCDMKIDLLIQKEGGGDLELVRPMSLKLAILACSEMGALARVCIKLQPSCTRVRDELV